MTYNVLSVTLSLYSLNPEAAELMTVIGDDADDDDGGDDVCRSS